MERKVRITGEDENMLTGFAYVYRELYRPDLTEEHKEYVRDALCEIAHNCVDRGFGLEIAAIKKEIDTEHKLKELKRAWNDGEIAT